MAKVVHGAGVLMQEASNMYQSARRILRVCVDLTKEDVFPAVYAVVLLVLGRWIDSVQLSWHKDPKKQGWDNPDAEIIVSYGQHIHIPIPISVLEEKGLKTKVRLKMDAVSLIAILKKEVRGNIVTHAAGEATSKLSRMGINAVPAILAELNIRPNNYLVDLQLLQALAFMDFHPSEVSEEMIRAVDQFRHFVQEEGQSPSTHRRVDAVRLLAKWGVNVDLQTVKSVEDLIEEWKKTRPTSDTLDELGFSLSTKYVLFQTKEAVKVWLPGTTYMDTLSGKGSITVQAGSPFILVRRGKKDYRIVFPAARVIDGQGLTVGNLWNVKWFAEARDFASNFRNPAESPSMESFKVAWIAEQKRYDFEWNYDITFEAKQHTMTKKGIRSQVLDIVAETDYEAKFDQFMATLG